MSIRITLPGGIRIETDTLAETVAVVNAFAPGAVVGEIAKKRTRVLTTNRDLDTLYGWGIVDEDSRVKTSREAWELIARDLGRSVDATQSLALRYVWGVYESSGSDPSAKAIVHPERDRSRPGWVDPDEA